MRKILIISVGKNKSKEFINLENEYLKRLPSNMLNLHEVKSHEENIQLEEKEIETKLKQISDLDHCNIILMTEKGKKLDSEAFSKWIFNDETTNRFLFFIIGGASGFSIDFKSKYNQTLSLSEMTLPHKVARLILIEQIYRAKTIFEGHPYHK